MQSLEVIAKNLDNTYWIGSQHDTVYGIFLWSDTPFVNTDYPYQLVFRFYSSGYEYVADTIQLKGGLNMSGYFTYGNGLMGKLVSPTKIVWSNGEEWNKIVNIPAVTTIDQYSTKYINDLQTYQSKMINNDMNKTYPRSNQFTEMSGYI
jgi:hypothetical protein